MGWLKNMTNHFFYLSIILSLNHLQEFTEDGSQSTTDFIDSSDKSESIPASILKSQGRKRYSPRFTIVLNTHKPGDISDYIEIRETEAYNNGRTTTKKGGIAFILGLT